ncbi:MAG: hypothetical protein R3D56_03960 [Paracoccaceae bacterium]
MALIDHIPAHRNDKIAAVTLEDVNCVARERMRPDRLTFTVVGHPVGLESTNRRRAALERTVADLRTVLPVGA